MDVFTQILTDVFALTVDVMAAFFVAFGIAFGFASLFAGRRLFWIGQHTPFHCCIPSRPNAAPLNAGPTQLDDQRQIWFLPVEVAYGCIESADRLSRVSVDWPAPVR